MSKGLRKITSAASNSNCTVVFINQIREKIGAFAFGGNTTSGGRALKFYSSVRIEVTRTGTNKSGGESVSNSTRAKVVKNKIAPPFREAEFDITFGQGIDTLGEVIDLGVKADIIQKSGAWYSYNGEQIGQGKEKAKDYFRQHSDLVPHIREQILEHFNKTEEDEYFSTETNEENSEE